MVQDLKFGNKCGTTFSGSSGSNKTGMVTTLTDKTYYGDCITMSESSAPEGHGYYYDWAAAINKSGAYNGGSSAGCSGSNGSSCQGICPANWHVPTAGTSTPNDYSQLLSSLQTTYGCACLACLKDYWDGLVDGWVTPTGTLGKLGNLYYWSSTVPAASSAFKIYITSTNCVYTDSEPRDYGHAVRCIKN
jgi:uncharacterized protein (TIGR02145 family)